MAKKSTTVSAAPAGGTAPAISPEVLARVYKATTAGGVGYDFVTEKEGAGLVAAGLIEINPAITDGDRVAAITTEAGAKLAQEHAGNDKAAADEAKAKFEIDDNVPLAPKRRGGNTGTREAIYPFDALNVNQSFHVPVSDKMPKPARSLASAVSAATAKYAVEVKDANGQTVMEPFERKDKAGTVIETGTRPKMQNTRVFTVRAVDASDPRGPGARIYRIS